MTTGMSVERGPLPLLAKQLPMLLVVVWPCRARAGANKPDQELAKPV